MRAKMPLPIAKMPYVRAKTIVLENVVPTKMIERPNFEGGHPQWGGFGDPNWIFRLGLAKGVSKVNYVSRPLNAI